MLHLRKHGHGDANADIYGTTAADVATPKYKMPLLGQRSDTAHALVCDELVLDGNARQNLATFCSTYLDPEIHQLMDLSIDKNMIDKDEWGPCETPDRRIWSFMNHKTYPRRKP